MFFFGDIPGGDGGGGSSDIECKKIRHSINIKYQIGATDPTKTVKNL